MKTSSQRPSRKIRRPALACEQCRRRKIKCDRQTPCRQCMKANVDTCIYVFDGGRNSTIAPFTAEDTQFSVFDTKVEPAPTLSYTASAAPSNDSEAPSMISTVGSNSLASSSRIDALCNDSEACSLTGTSYADQNTIPFPSTLPPHFHQSQLQSGIETNMYGCQLQPMTLPFAHLDPIVGGNLQGTFFKTRFHGHSNWLNFAHQSKDVLAIIEAHESEEGKNDNTTFTRCKSISRIIKDQESTAMQQHGSTRDMIASREEADMMVHAYFCTFQVVFRIVDKSTFQKEYDDFWGNINPVRDAFGVTLLLVMCIGSTVSVCRKWVNRTKILQRITFASSWLNKSNKRSRLSLDGIRIYCLLLLARQTIFMGADHANLSAGSLLRTAMHAGLHIDPDPQVFPNISPLERESRRRLWATVLELELKYSMDSGSLPSVNPDDYNCGLPSNVNDTKLNGDFEVEKPLHQFTDSSMQILLTSTIPIRLKVAKFLNSFRPENSYKKALGLTEELSAELRRCSVIIEGFNSCGSPPTTVQKKIFDLLVQRFLLGLHHPFAVQAKQDPSFYYSTKVCMETSLSLFPPAAYDNLNFLHLDAISFFRDVYTQGVLFMCGELTDQYASSLSIKDWKISLLKEMREAIDSYLEHVVTRIEAGEKGTKHYVLVSCLLAQAEATRSGTNMEQGISDGLKRSLETCYILLNAQVKNESPMEWELQNENIDWSEWESLAGLNAGEQINQTIPLLQQK